MNTGLVSYSNNSNQPFTFRLFFVAVQQRAFTSVFGDVDARPNFKAPGAPCLDPARLKFEDIRRSQA